MALVALLACSASAFAAGGAGHNVQTERLEAAFKIALFERAGDAGGCYPDAAPLAAVIRERTLLRTSVAPGLKAVRRDGVVYVVKQGASCGRVRLALSSGEKLYILDSARGPVYVQGQGGGRKPEDPSLGVHPPLKALTLTSKTFRMTAPDETQRLTVLCPGKAHPLGGGMRGTPGPGPDGEGVYPHSYERLGVQRGFHISPVMIDPSPGSTTPRQVTIQVVCARGIVPTSSPHKTVFLKPGQTKTVVARCPKGSYLFSGGFQRTDIRTPGGDYVTESRAIGPKAWRVTGHAFGLFGGELTSIAHCVRYKRPLLTEVSASTPLPASTSATATTPPCPRGRRLTAGGFSANGSQQALFAGGWFNSNGTWSAAGFGYFGPAPSLTAYGYCLRI